MSQSKPVCHEGISRGTTTATAVITATNSGPARPPSAMASTAMNTHITSASWWAKAASITVRHEQDDDHRPRLAPPAVDPDRQGHEVADGERDEHDDAEHAPAFRSCTC